MRLFFQLLGFLFSLILVLIFPSKVLASSVLINEFLPNPSENNPEWVEIYNSSGEGIDLTGWYLEDAANHKKSLDSLGNIEAGEVKALDGESDGWLLNNGSETVYLKDDGDNQIDSYSYSSDPGEDKSIGRETNGSSNWIIFEMPTKGTNNVGGSSSSSSPSPSPSSSPSPESSPTSASYKINEVKNEDGEVLSSVKIYVDDIYLHHYAPETLTFCDGCRCDDYVDCGFGEHTIKLEKSGFQNWIETKTINSNETYEVNPTMKLSESDSSSSLSSPSPSPSTEVPGTVVAQASSQSSKSTKSEEMLIKEASFTGEVFGASESGDENDEEKDLEENNKRKLNWLLPLGLSASGLVLVGGAAFPFLKPKLKKFFHRRT